MTPEQRRAAWSEKLRWLRKERAEIDAHKAANRIKYITTPPNKGFNPLQERIVQAWLKPNFKSFVFSGSNRLGKTFLGVHMALATMFGEYPWDGTDLSYLFPHNKPRRVRYIGQDWQSHIKKVVIPEIRQWWPEERPVETSSNGIIRDTTWMDKETGSTLDILSNYQDTDVHEGANFDVLIVDEPCRRDIWIANARGLVDRQGRALFCMTLLKEPWIHKEIIKRLNEDGTPDRSVFAVDGDITNNIGYGITEEGVEQFSRHLTDAEKQVRIHGKPAYLSNLICPAFDRGVHILDERFRIPSNWLVDIGIDIHPRKEQAVLFVATDPKNDRYAFYEIWEHGSGDEIANHIVRIVSRYALRVNRVVCDPLAKGDKNEENTTFDRIDRVLNRHGMVLETATKDKDSGIITINEHLKGPNKKPSLFFFPDLKMTISQLEGWMWDEDALKRGEFKAQKKDDDFPENLYRILLLDTEYEDEFDDFEPQPRVVVDATTGY